jgi:hypothetical protein
MHHALGTDRVSPQAEGFDPFPIGYKLAGRQGARVKEPLVGDCIVIVRFDLPKY